MLGYKVREKPLPLVFAVVTVASGLSFLASMFIDPFLYVFIAWAAPLPFLAAAFMLFINREIEDRNFTLGYIGLWAVVGLGLIPLSIVMIVWVTAIEHDYQVGEICEPGLPEDVCTPTSTLVNQTNSMLLPPAFSMMGWIVPSLLFVILGYSYRLF